MMERKFVSEVVIMVAVCVGAWMLFVGPKLDELHGLEQTIAEAERDPVHQRRATIERMATQVQEIRAQIRRVETQNVLALDSSRMYGLITSLAKTHGVVVQQLDPGRLRAADDELGVTTMRFDMSAEGPYERVAEFLEAIERLDGFVRPEMLNITPIGDADRPRVTARFSFEALNFPVPGVLAQMLGGVDADG